MPEAVTTTETVETATTETVEAPEAAAVPTTPEAAQAGETPDDLRKALESANARIKELNKENEKRRKDNEAAERKAAEEQGKFKELYEAEIAKREAAEAQAAQLERARLLDRIAAEHKLPEALRDRLKGETEEELKADAEQLAKLMVPAKPDAPNLDATARGTLQPGQMTDARREEIRQRFRV